MRYLALIFLALLTTPSHAAGIDCTKAATQRENAICADPKLLELDNELSDAFTSAMSKLSKVGQSQQAQAQRSWIRFTDQLCAGPIPDNISLQQKNCANLDSTYRDRITVLKRVGEKRGAYRLNYIVLQKLEPVGDGGEDDSGSYPGFFYFYYEYRLIDRPDSPNSQRFNAFIRAKKKKSFDEGFWDITKSTEGHCEPYVRLRLGAVGEGIAGMGEEYSEYCHGTNHGHGTSSAYLLDFDAKPKELKSGDVFNNAIDWRTKMRSIFLLALKSQHEPDVIKDLSDAALDLESWFFSNDGLEFQSSSYSGGCYACRIEIDTIPWSDIKPLLKPGSPVLRLVPKE